MALRWVPSGPNWLTTAWVGDTQVIYALFLDTTLVKDYRIVRKVAGSAHPSGVQIGAQHDLANAKKIAVIDIEELQKKGL